MGSFIGIDLGTTFSAVATIDATGRPVIIHNEDGSNITPSCVHEKESGVMEVGEEARRTWGINPSKAAARFKRNMGTSAVYTVNGMEFDPTQLSTFVLKKLLKFSEREVGKVGEAVVTIPANFSNEAREATMAAAKGAGLNVKYIINEPTAAALYYAFKNNTEFHGNYAVYDLGGGTFDVSIIEVNGQDIKVLATNGVTKLGGDDFDRCLIDIVGKKYLHETGNEMDPDDYTPNDAEQDKKSLSKAQKISAKIGRKFIDVTKKEFEEAISSKIAQAEMLCEATIEEASLTPNQIKSVLLAGGSTRIPLVQESIRRVFKQDPVASVNVDEVVALGAALYAAYKGDQSKLTPVQKNSIQKIKVAETTSKCFGTITFTYDHARSEDKLENSILISKGDKIPCSVTKSFYTRYEGQTNVKCQLTESTSPETDPRFVKIVWEGDLNLPPNRPSDQEIRVTYSYDENQIMKCSFVDVATSRKKDVELSMSSTIDDEYEISKFIVE